MSTLRRRFQYLALLTAAAAFGQATKLSITNTSPLPAAQAGQAYTVTFTATGGAPPYTWAANQGLPAGLQLDRATGVLSGIPATGGKYSLTIQVTDVSSNTVLNVYALNIAPAPLAIVTTSPLFSGTAGQPYAQTFTASGGTTPYSWSIAGGDTGGLTMDATAGVLRGTPAAAGTFSFRVQVTDAAAGTASQAYSLTVNAPALTIPTGAALPTATAGSAYSQSFNVVGGTGPYTWSVTAGSIPGLTFDPAQVTLSGTPSTPGAFSITLQARDSTGLSASKAFTLTVVSGSLKFTSGNQLTDASFAQPYTYSLTAAGGTPPYAWSANGLPDGLTIDAASGVISGTPAAAGPFSFTVRVFDATRATVVDLFRITVNLPALPNVSVTGMPAAAGPAAQFPVKIALDSAFVAPLTGQAILSFAADTGSGDGTIQFAGGGRSAAFTIPAGSTSPTPDQLAIQTGTVAGTLTVTLRLLAGGIDITPTPAPAVSTRIERAAPVLLSATASRSGGTLTISVTGYTTALEVTQATFTFAATAGHTLQTSTVNVSVDTLFSTWFQDPTSAQYGSQFVFAQPFTITGADATAVTPQSVTLTNRIGTASVNITQ